MTSPNPLILHRKWKGLGDEAFGHPIQQSNQYNDYPIKIQSHPYDTERLFVMLRNVVKSCWDEIYLALSGSEPDQNTRNSAYMTHGVNIRW